MRLQELKNILKEMGVVGAGGAGFPTYGKLSYDVNKVILNGAECEPLFRVDRNLLSEHVEDVLAGLNIIVETLGATEGIIAFKEHYKEANESVDEVLYRFPKLRKKLLKDGYPAGDEVVLVYETTGLVVPQGRLPLAVGAMVINVETALNVYRAVELGKSVTHKYLTVGGTVNNPKTVRAPIGTCFKDLIEQCGGSTIKEYKLLIGGPMTGRIGKISETVTKTTKGIFLLPQDNPIVELREYRLDIAIKRTMGVCSQCRMCTDLCPRNLLGHSIEPHRIMNSLAFGLDYNTDVFVNALACCECNLCSVYSCHQQLNPKAIISDLKTRLRDKGIKLPTLDNGVDGNREYRRVPVDRIIKRLKLTRYDVDAPLLEIDKVHNTVKISTKQSVGVAVKPVISNGDRVEIGQVIGSVDESDLGVFLHSPINGIVEEIDKDKIIIRRER